MKINELVSNTAEVFIDEINDNKIYGKLEFQNPTCSIKDRAAKYVLEYLLKKIN